MRKKNSKKSKETIAQQ